MSNQKLSPKPLSARVGEREWDWIQTHVRRHGQDKAQDPGRKPAANHTEFITRLSEPESELLIEPEVEMWAVRAWELLHAAECPPDSGPGPRPGRRRRGRGGP